MYYWNQNLSDGKKLFHFRGSIGSSPYKKWLGYEFCSGASLKCQIEMGHEGSYQSMLILGLFFFTAYLTFSLPKWMYTKETFVKTWEPEKPRFELVSSRVYGFYFHQWAFVWSFHQKTHESSSKDPWWMRQYIYIDELFLGKSHSIEYRILGVENVDFKIGEKTFTMDSIVWTKYNRFRSFVPFALYNKPYVRVEMKISRPPMVAGKGENSWDLDDDGSYGMSTLWPHETPNWVSDMNDISKKAVNIYVDSVMKDLDRRGKASHERSFTKSCKFQYIGVRRNELSGSLAEI